MARTYTLQEAAEATGLTRKSLENRCDRRQLQYVVRGGKRRIPHAELVRVGLLPKGGSLEAPPSDLPPDALSGLLARLEAQAEEIGRLRVLEVQAGGQAAALEAERAKVRELEEALETERSRPWYRRRR